MASGILLIGRQALDIRTIDNHANACDNYEALPHLSTPLEEEMWDLSDPLRTLSRTVRKHNIVIHTVLCSNVLLLQFEPFSYIYIYVLVLALSRVCF